VSAAAAAAAAAAVYCIRVSFSAAAPALQFVLATYDINGTWLGLHNWTVQLQVCGARLQEAAKWTRSVIRAVTLTAAVTVTKC
jgi:hypothetical protein